MEESGGGGGGRGYCYNSVHAGPVSEVLEVLRRVDS